MSAPARTGITHFAWPGRLAVVFGTPAPTAAAVFGPAGWQVGPPDTVFRDPPPADAAVSSLELPRDLVDQLAGLEFVTGGLHTEFVNLERLVQRLQADGEHGVVLVLGRSPIALAVGDGHVSVIAPQPPHAPIDVLIRQASGWIVHIHGNVAAHHGVTVWVPAATAGAAAATGPAAVAPPQPDTGPAVSESPVIELPQAPAPIESPPAPVESAAPAPVAARPASAPAAGDAAATAIGRFPASTRFLLSPGVDGHLPPEVADLICEEAGERGLEAVHLLDGDHSLADVASVCGLSAAQVAGVVEVLLSQKLAFRYWSRTRPQTGASASR